MKLKSRNHSFFFLSCYSFNYVIHSNNFFLSSMQLKVKRVTLAAELPLKFGLSLLEGNVPKIRETAHNGIRIFPKPEKLTATSYFYASAFIAYEHFPSVRDPLTMIQFIELNDQTVNKADIRKSCTHIKKQLKAYEIENPYFLVFHYLYHCL